MKLLAGTPRCLLVIAPHADDESIGAHALMTRFRRRGVEVRVVVVTDGSASHPGSTRWPRARLIRERQRETRRAVRRIGVAAGKITFLGFPDGGTEQVRIQTARAIAVALRHAPKPLLVVAPAATDAHPDHRIVALGVTMARVARVRRLAYPVWPAGTRMRGARCLTLTAQERLAKRWAIESYRTQAGGITDDPTGFSMTKHQIAAFSGPIETFVERRW